MLKVLSKIFPSKSEKDVRRILPIVEEINRYAEEFQKLSDEELKGKSAEFRGRLKEATKGIEEETAALKEQLKAPENMTLEERESVYSQLEQQQKDLDAATSGILNEILPETYAVVKETC
ncbi:MAG: preprotein translocase subunit SecA, partial [Ignavibacteria bacterium]